METFQSLSAKSGITERCDVTWLVTGRNLSRGAPSGLRKRAVEKRAVEEHLVDWGRGQWTEEEGIGRGQDFLLCHDWNTFEIMTKKKVLPLVTMWIDLEGIMLSEMRQKKTNTIWYHIYMESEKAKFMEKESRMVAREMEEINWRNNWNFALSVRQISVIKQISSEDLRIVPIINNSV